MGYVENPIKNSRFYLEQQSEPVDFFSVAGGDCAVASLRCPGGKINQDAAVIVPVSDASVVFAVADGAGGHPQGDVAARIAVQAVHHEIKSHGGRRSSDLRTSIINGFEAANRNILALGTGAAATLVVVEVVGHVARTYHAGDSVALVNGLRGKEKYKTVSHSPVGLGIEAGLIDEIDYSIQENYSLVTNLVGSPRMRIEVGSPFELDAKDTILLASDGLTDNLTEAEISVHLQNTDFSSIAGGLIEEAQKNMDHSREDGPSKPDDLTFILFRR
jgi:serine/threonine protein phosphatase PrpC